MKKILFSLALIGMIGTANATDRYGRPMPPRYDFQARQIARDANHTADVAKTIAVAAVFVGIVSLVVAVRASEHNPGQVRLVQF